MMMATFLQCFYHLLKHLLPFQAENEINEVAEINDIQLSTLINQIQETCTNKMSDSQAQEWACLGVDEDLGNHEILTDDQILQIAAKEDDIDDEDESGSISTSKVSPSEAVNALNCNGQKMRTWIALIIY